MEDLIAGLAEERVNRISFQGLGRLAEDIDRQLGLSLFGDSDTLDEAAGLVEVRNLIIHNHGIVNRTFLTRLDRFANDIRLGEDLQVDANGVELALTALRKGVQSIDARTAAKFKLALFP